LLQPEQLQAFALNLLALDAQLLLLPEGQMEKKKKAIWNPEVLIISSMLNAFKYFFIMNEELARTRWILDPRLISVSVLFYYRTYKVFNVYAMAWTIKNKNLSS
jgi:hypothetical protein